MTQLPEESLPHFPENTSSFLFLQTESAIQVAVLRWIQIEKNEAWSQAVGKGEHERVKERRGEKEWIGVFAADHSNTVKVLHLFLSHLFSSIFF